MSFVKKSVFAFAVAFVLASAVAGFTPVVELTDDSFEQFITGKGLVVAKFYASWCPHSKEFAPKFEEVAQRFENRATFVQIDAPENEELSRQFEIDGYPTIVFIQGGEFDEYRDGRTVDQLAAATERKLLPDVSLLNSEEAVKAFASSDRVVVIGYFISEDAQEYTEFTKASKGYKQEIRFGFINDYKIAAKFGIKSQPSITMFKTFDEPRHDYEGEYTAEAIDDFITVHSIPLLDELTPDNYRLFTDSGIPFLVSFVDVSNATQKESVLSFLKPLASKYRSRLTFSWADQTQYATFGQTLGISSEDVPTGVIQTFQPTGHYIFNKDNEYNAENVEKWISAYHGGELQPDIRSQEVPEQDEEDPLTIVVADSFENIVLDAGADVFVQFYAPWCGHCKALAPTWDELADIFAGVDSVVIAKIDATENDVIGVDITGYPTLLFYPAGRKDDPIEYDGERDLDSLIKFIEDNADIEFTIPEEEYDGEGDEEEEEDGEYEGQDGEEEEEEEDN